jgi:hypothetical protein
MVLGLQLSFENPSYAAVCIACLNAFLPKSNYLRSINCEGYWPAHGIPSVIVTDNGNEFWGKNFEAIASEVGCTFQYCLYLSLLSGLLMSATGYLGAQLVYEYAIGVDIEEAAAKRPDA